MSPALKTRLPPSPVVPVPTATATPPPLPPVAAPVPMRIDPDAPPLDVPVEKDRAPLPPLYPASGCWYGDKERMRTRRFEGGT